MPRRNLFDPLTAPFRLAVVHSHQMILTAITSSLPPIFKVVAEACSAQEALRLAAADAAFDVLLIEYELPDMSGSLLLSEWLKRCAGSRACMLSSTLTRPVIFGAFEAGASAFVDKSQPMDVLHTGLHAAARGGLYLCPVTSHIANPFHNNAQRDLLSQRERETINLVSRGRSNKEIAVAMGVAVDTVRGHRKRSRRKLGATSTVEMLAKARILGYL